jgi:hypothetical protein
MTVRPARPSLAKIIYLSGVSAMRSRNSSVIKPPLPISLKNQSFLDSLNMKPPSFGGFSLGAWIEADREWS